MLQSQQRGVYGAKSSRTQIDYVLFQFLFNRYYSHGTDMRIAVLSKIVALTTFDSDLG